MVADLVGPDARLSKIMNLGCEQLDHIASGALPTRAQEADGLSEDEPGTRDQWAEARLEL